jgi:hypothetical protein
MIGFAKLVGNASLSFVGLQAALWLAVATAPAEAQQMMQLDIPLAEYSLGRFTYAPPKVDGWRQMARLPNTVSLVYAEQIGEEQIETRFGVVFEAHDIPADTKVEGAAALADLSRRQMAEARKADLVGLSPIEAVPSMENLYTYRLLVKSPLEGKPNVYEVYYVMMSPDATQYLVAQCITKTEEYANELYFQQFYGSLVSLKYTPPASSPAAKEGDSAKPADVAKPAEAAAKPDAR